MNSETMIITGAVALLAAAVGYLIATVLAKKSQSEGREQLAASNAEQAQLQRQNAEQAKSLKTVAEQLRTLELDLKQSQTQFQSETLRKQELTDELKQIKAKSDAQTEQVKAAEKNSEAAQVEVKELRSQDADLKKRLSASDTLIADIRTQLTSQKQATADQTEKSKEFEIKAQEANKNSDDLKQRLTALNVRYDELQEKYTGLSGEHSELKTQLDERDASHVKQLQQFESQKKELTKEFENLASKIFDEKGKTFSATSQQNLNQLLKPFSDQLEGFQKRVNDVHGMSLQNNSQLQTEIQKVVEMGIKMSGDANNLATALKGDKKALGNWGELQVEKLLQMTGLEEGREYQRERSFKAEDGRDQRPDFIINLPNEKHLIVDSKMSLNSHVLAVQADTEETRAEHLNDHGKAIRKHIRDLSAKNYTKLKGVKSPEFVFMFIGSDAAYLAALEAEPKLISGAYERGIAIVTPNTLLASLRIVSHLWSIDKQNNNTKELAEQASKVYDKLRIFVEKMEKLGNQINTVQKTYGDSWNTLSGPNASLTKQVSKFVDMGVTVKEKLAASLTEDDDMESLAVSAIQPTASQQATQPEVFATILPKQPLLEPVMPPPIPELD